MTPVQQTRQTLWTRGGQRITPAHSTTTDPNSMTRKDELTLIVTLMTRLARCKTRARTVATDSGDAGQATIRPSEINSDHRRGTTVPTTQHRGDASDPTTRQYAIRQRQTTTPDNGHARPRANTLGRHDTGNTTIRQYETRQHSVRANGAQVNNSTNKNRYVLLDPDAACDDIPEKATKHGWTVVTHERKPQKGITTTSRRGNARTKVEARVDESTCGDAEVEAYVGEPTHGDARIKVEARVDGHPRGDAYSFIPSPDPGVTPLPERLDAQSDVLGVAHARTTRTQQLRRRAREATVGATQAGEEPEQEYGDTPPAEPRKALDSNGTDRGELDESAQSARVRSPMMQELRRRIQAATSTTAETSRAEEARPPTSATGKTTIDDSRRERTEQDSRGRSTRPRTKRSGPGKDMTPPDTSWRDDGTCEDEEDVPAEPTATEDDVSRNSEGSSNNRGETMAPATKYCRSNDESRGQYRGTTNQKSTRARGG
ncbi:hypothetical protein EDB89DRAFT_1907300 [Lactarius sanguifluus]|nr:hypothetical protein EDB89DRAFT_1907300 [Lactarius sanguifluus]